jgi:uncharacterized protein YjbJ (UPF0337 family)
MVKAGSESMTTAVPGLAGNSTDEVAAIRGEIERTRGEMSRTVNEIEERLSPAHVKEQVANVAAGLSEDLKGEVSDLKASMLESYHEVKDHVKADIGRELREAKQMASEQFTHARTAVREATVGRVEHMVHDARESVSSAGTTVFDTIKANPIPAALAAVGIGWLLMSGRSSPRSSSGQSRYHPLGYGEGRTDLGQRAQEGASHLVDEARQAIHGASDAVSHVAHDAGEKVEEIAGDARDAAVHLVDDAGQTGRRALRSAGRGIVRAERGIESTLRANPLAAGAVTLAIGAAIGLSLPHTHVEDEWMGEAKDRLMDRAEGAAGEVIHKAEDAVGQLTTGKSGGSDRKSDVKELSPKSQTV